MFYKSQLLVIFYFNNQNEQVKFMWLHTYFTLSVSLGQFGLFWVVEPLDLHNHVALPRFP